ncbi:hypothetical protein I4U23_013580 [Adineta vaga]|nr:hypothetical protein I4U23_013580 [Adineta vaga]
MQYNRFPTNNTSRNKQIQRCRDGHDCLLQHDNSNEHNSLYSHPCRWSELCREMNNNSEHARLFTHEPHRVSLCKYGTDSCTKLTDPEHRRDHRHEGLPDFLAQCRYKAECRDHSTEHLKKFAHPMSFYQQSQNFKINSRNNQTQSSIFNQKACRYGSDCRNRSDPEHCNRYSHPMMTTSSQSSNSSTKSFTPQLLFTSTNNSTTRIPRKLPTSNSHMCGGGDDMEHAYRIGGALALDSLSKSDQQAIQTMSADKIIVVPGSYDHIDRVLSSLNIKFITVQQHEISTYPFRADQTVYINCTSTFPKEAAKRLRQEVEKGLHIITTDWALAHIHDVAFSDFIRYNRQSTRDEVVGIQVADSNHPLVNGFLPASKHAQPQWWLETGSYPIEIINRDKVRTLIRSETLGRNYHSDAVLVTFDCGRGNVIHMISHFYLQRSETRDSRHQMSAQQYALDIKASPAATTLVAQQGQNLNYAQIQSSSTSAQFIYNQLSTRLNSRK